MAKEPVTITLDPASELARALAEADAPVVLDSNGVRYTVDREDVFAHYDPQAAIARLRALREVFAGVDTAQLLRDLRAQRAQDSQGRPA